MQGIKTDILIIRGGLAGASAAIKVRESRAYKVTIVSNGKIKEGENAGRSQGLATKSGCNRQA